MASGGWPPAVHASAVGGGMTLNQINRANEPRVEIVEEPKSHGLRFRYQCEGRSAGSIPGERTTGSHRTYPSIAIHNYNGPSAVVVVSLVTRDKKPHPHRLVGKDCQFGVCTIKLQNNYSLISFPQIGIQCVKKQEIKESLQKRQDVRVDPFGTGFAHIENINELDMGVVRLCFQVFLPDTFGKFTRALQPALSQAIYDKKATNDLVICRISRNSGSAAGGTEVFLLCEKVYKDDIQVRFFEETLDGIKWEDFAKFGQADVHKQHAIVFTTPAYRDTSIQSAREVSMQLIRTTDKAFSDPKPFQYVPDDPDPDAIEVKRKRKKVDGIAKFMTDTIPAVPFLTEGYGVQNSFSHVLPATNSNTAAEITRQKLISKVNRNQQKASTAAVPTSLVPVPQLLKASSQADADVVSSAAGSAGVDLSAAMSGALGPGSQFICDPNTDKWYMITTDYGGAQANGTAAYLSMSELMGGTDANGGGGGGGTEQTGVYNFLNNRLLSNYSGISTDGSVQFMTSLQEVGIDGSGSNELAFSANNMMQGIVDSGEGMEGVDGGGGGTRMFPEEDIQYVAAEEEVKEHQVSH